MARSCEVVELIGEALSDLATRLESGEYSRDERLHVADITGADALSVTLNGKRFVVTVTEEP